MDEQKTHQRTLLEDDGVQRRDESNALFPNEKPSSEMHQAKLTDKLEAIINSKPKVSLLMRGPHSTKAEFALLSQWPGFDYLCSQIFNFAEIYRQYTASRVDSAKG